MIRFRVIAAALVILAVALAARPWPAAASTEVKLIYWPSNLTYSAPGLPNGTWTTNFIGGDVRWTSDAARWGIHLKYDTGSQTNWGGLFGGGFFRSGTDTIWSADVFYAWQFPAVTVRGFAGYGDLESTGNQAGGSITYKATGYRVGADAAVPIPNTNFAFNASAAWYPSTSTSLTFSPSGATRTSGGSATDLSASIQYAWPNGFLVEGGYRWINNHLGSLALVFVGTGETTAGPFFAAGYHW